MESLYYGVPMVGVPQMPEQMMTARRIQELGLGTALDAQTLTVELLHTTMKAALSNADYRTNAQAMQQHVRNAGGYKRAADAIMNFAQNQRNETTYLGGRVLADRKTTLSQKQAQRMSITEHWNP